MMKPLILAAFGGLILAGCGASVPDLYEKTTDPEEIAWLESLRQDDEKEHIQAYADSKATLATKKYLCSAKADQLFRQKTEQFLSSDPADLFPLEKFALAERPWLEQAKVIPVLKKARNNYRKACKIKGPGTTNCNPNYACDYAEYWAVKVDEAEAGKEDTFGAWEYVPPEE